MQKERKGGVKKRSVWYFFCSLLSQISFWPLEFRKISKLGKCARFGFSSASSEGSEQVFYMRNDRYGNAKDM